MAPQDLPPLELQEHLGRALFSSKHRKRAAKQKPVPHQAFMPEQGLSRISVDRLDRATEDEILPVKEADAQQRGRSFYGWVAVTTEEARQRGRSAYEAPTEENEFHAEINYNVNLNTDDAEDQLIQHADDLAKAAACRWRPCPEYS